MLQSVSTSTQTEPAPLEAERPHAGSPGAPTARAIAFYLPQFHPVPENDAWWGPGFTEWTNAAKARPLYRGHVQPHLPADLGFYDLRLAASREAQARLAQRYGIEAFCYWHYWFGEGQRILDRPFREVLDTGSPGISFCLAWANQTWTGTWHGAPDRVLVRQTYPGPDDERAHFAAIENAFHDRRYLRVNGKPVFYVFRPEQLPDSRRFVEHWRALAQASGLPGLYLVAEVSDLLGGGPAFHDPIQHGFDAGVYMRLPARTSPMATFRMRWQRKVLRHPERFPYAPAFAEIPRQLRGECLPTVYPNWDNTPRSGRRGLVLEGSRPELFTQAVRGAAEHLQTRPVQERLLFIKSWNEWAEGNYLEPDLEHGHAYLEALAAGLGTS
jgi:hypothetical protein